MFAQLSASNQQCSLLSSWLCRDSEDRSGKIKEGELRRIVSAEDENGTLRPLPLPLGSRQVKTVVEVREILKNYPVSREGAVPWQ